MTTDPDTPTTDEIIDRLTYKNHEMKMHEFQRAAKELKSLQNIIQMLINEQADLVLEVASLKEKNEVLESWQSETIDRMRDKTYELMELTGKIKELEEENEKVLDGRRRDTRTIEKLISEKSGSHHEITALESQLQAMSGIHEGLKDTVKELEARPTVDDDVSKAFDKGRHWSDYCKRQYPVDPEDETDMKILQERLENAEEEKEIFVDEFLKSNDTLSSLYEEDQKLQSRLEICEKVLKKYVNGHHTFCPEAYGQGGSCNCGYKEVTNALKHEKE